jgi:hypothetical protein
VAPKRSRTSDRVTTSLSGKTSGLGRAGSALFSASTIAPSMLPPPARPSAMNTGIVPSTFEISVGAWACGTYIVRRGSARSDCSRMPPTTPTISGA